jgi:hypothetical protein
MVQVGIRKASVSESLTKCRNFLGRHQNRGVLAVLGGVWRLPAYWPGGVRHGGDASLICCFPVEREKVCPDTAASDGGARGSVPSSRNCKGLSTVAGCAGGLAGSSCEAPVTGVEPRGQVICGVFARSTGYCPGGVG